MKLRSLLFALMCFSASTTLFAASQIQVITESAWLRWLPNGLAAGYLTLKNPSEQPLELVSASSPDYEQVSLHQTVTQGTMSKMMKIDKLIIPAHQEIALAPGGYHLMLEQPTHNIVPGGTVQVQLKFADDEKIVNVTMPVRSPASGAPH